MRARATSPQSTPLAALVDLTGRTAIVTGGAMGIGAGIARRLHEAGANVVVADLDEAAAEATAGELVGVRPHTAVAVHADVGDEESVQAMVAAAVAAFGSLNILVNNAGIYPMTPITGLDAAAFRHVLDVNLTGVFMCTKAAAARMVAQGGGGRIVNITSIDALHPSMVGLAHYDASKHGAWGFTKNAALELAQHEIWVNAVAPGGIATPGAALTDEASRKAFEAMIPMRRLGDPDDIGRAVLFLASDLASYMTGSQIVVDGGRLLN
ncbi:MAG TPA: SDR family NAD(P)-dependent oxidoreductase [Solirubrobacteraceae bacterium]|nr:SDR family NAD(P)-dependent oxidoreductase [Solirubrobacteraceae bacterium]